MSQFSGKYIVISLSLMTGIFLFKKSISQVILGLKYWGVTFAFISLIAWPIIIYGTDWVSVSNDDMANYCLGAQRFLSNGFSEFVNVNNLSLGKDYSQAFWFMHVAAGQRAGAELLLAHLWSITGFNAHQIFMPTILSLNIVLLGSIVLMSEFLYANSRKANFSLLIAGLSPLIALGTIYQLIAQVGGLSLLIGLMIFFINPRQTFSASFPTVVISVIIFSATFIYYPEVLPFFGITWLIYVAIGLFGRKIGVKTVIIRAVIVGAIVLMVLNRYAFEALIFMYGQATSVEAVSGGDQFVLFPYFLVPNGLPTLLGLETLVQNNYSKYYSTLMIGASLILLFLIIKQVIKKFIIADISAIACMVMFLVAIILFVQKKDFGLFKIAMFIQPFLAVLVGGVIGSASNHKKKILLLLFVWALFAIYAQQKIVEKSTDGSSVLNEVPNASGGKILQKFQSSFSEVVKKDPGASFISETPNVVLAKYMSLYAAGSQLIFPSRNYYESIIRRSDLGKEYDELIETSTPYKEEISLKNKFYMQTIRSLNDSDLYYIYFDGQMDVFNKYHSYSKGLDGEFVISKERPKNRLIFIHSDLGPHYYSFHRKNAAFYQIENDVMFPDQTFSALGRHIQFIAMNPSSESRMILELTSTVLKQFDSKLPSLDINAKTKISIPGRGSARIYTPLVEYSKVGDVNLLQVNFDRLSKKFNWRPWGLENLYGRDIKPDQRNINIFARDISVISDKDYQAMRPPVSLQKFPLDLANKNLEYSGIYEDGWISEDSFFVLSTNESSKIFVIKGSIPQINDPNFTTVLSVVMDGIKIHSQKLKVGNFEIDIPVVGLNGKRRMEIHFSSNQRLPGADGRIVGGKVEFVGFK